MSITAITSFYAANAASAVRSTSASAASKPSTAGTSSAPTSESTTVHISNEARQAAAREGGIAIPESVRQSILAEQNRVFPQDILDEAQARLQANPGISGNSSSSATPGLGNLPLLPENEALLKQIKQEMHAAHAASTEGTDITPYFRLIMAVQSEGWKSPMTMEDAQREVDISQAMARLTPASSAAPLSEAEQWQKDKATMAQFEQERAGKIPDQWKQRWQEAKLSMPETTSTPFPQSIWLGLAKSAGISEDEFLGKARELAGKYSGNSFLQAVESFVSERYSASSGKTQTS
ncbi:hypothetical protein [Azonexus sp.]|uniref:hypothetical protein n=1 Tax=Azonexus sp. TaxID=1872668 RepID=UPI0027B951D3|nr:hypothetical protein [Azonexus sp.]